MRDFEEQLHRVLQGRVCLVGVGNVDQGDDGLGVRLAETLAAWPDTPAPHSPDRPPATPGQLAPAWGRSRLGFDILNAETAPERWVSQLADGRFDNVVFLDAVEFGGRPGDVLLLDTRQMAARLPQVSTHRISLSLLANCIQAAGRARVWLLGVQPAALRPGEGLSQPARRTLELLRDLIAGVAGLARPVTEGCPDHVTRTAAQGT